MREHAAGGGALNVVAVSSKMMLAYNQTRVERMYEKSRFAQVDAELGRLMEAYREDYRNLTEKLLEEEVDYDTAVTALERIAAGGMFA